MQTGRGDTIGRIVYNFTVGSEGEFLGKKGSGRFMERRNDVGA